MKNTATYRRFTILDGVIILVFLGAAVVGYPLIQQTGPETVVVYRDSEKLAEYPLAENHDFKVMGVNGVVCIATKDGKAQVVSSSCRNQICVHHAPISKSGAQIVCAPNRILVIIESKNKDREIDGLAR